MHEKQHVGELGGAWTFFFRLSQLLIPLLAIVIIPWSVWVTNTLFHLEARISKIESWVSLGPRFTPADADALRLRIISETSFRIDGVNQTILNKLDELKNQLVDVKLEVTKHTSANGSNQK